MITGSEQRGRAGSARQYEVAIERRVMVTVRDGVELACDIYRPALGGRAVSESFPTILERTPYDRTRIDLYLMGQYFASRGYNVVLQDCRGRHDSDGTFQLLYDEGTEGTDGYDTVEWIAEQPWSDGQVGTTGISYTGTNQQALAVLKPPHLTTQVILDAGINYWYRTQRHSGAFVEGVLLPYAFWMAAVGKEAQADPLLRRRLQHALEHMDEWVERLPLKRGASPLAGAPSYEEWYFQTACGADYDEKWMSSLASLELYIDDYPDIPISFVTSWYGHHVWATFEKWMKLSKQNTQPVKVVCGTWLHAFRYMEQSWAGETEFGNSVAMDLNEFRLRWFDQYMKGLETGAAEDPPIRLFVMGGGDGSRNLSRRIEHGGGWRDEAEWPIARTDWARFYLHADGSLRPEPPEEDDVSTTYVFDPDDPVPTIGGCVQDPLGGEKGIVNGGGFDQRGRTDLIACKDTARLETRPDVIVFRTAPLEEDVEITGPIKVQLWVSSSAVDTDFSAKLIDEYPSSADYPDGFALNLCDSIVRMRYRNRRRKAELIEPHEVYDLAIEPQPTSNLFRAGHRIRLDISSSNWPQFDVNANTGGPLGVSQGNVRALNTIHHDASRPSHVVLPVVPAR
jgi:putative CocE/NonD family hydrolase